MAAEPGLQGAADGLAAAGTVELRGAVVGSGKHVETEVSALLWLCLWQRWTG